MRGLGGRAPFRSRHPRSGQTNKAHFGGAVCPARAQSTVSQCAPHALPRPSIPGRSLGAPHLRRAGGAGVARRCPRERRRRAAPEVPRSRPGGRAYRRRCSSLLPRFPRRLLPRAAAVAGGPDLFTSYWWRRLREACGCGGGQVALQRPLAPRGWTRALPAFADDSPPRRLGFWCPHLPLAPGLPLWEPLHPLHLEEKSGGRSKRVPRVLLSTVGAWAPQISNGLNRGQGKFPSCSPLALVWRPNPRQAAPHAQCGANTMPQAQKAQINISVKDFCYYCKGSQCLCLSPTFHRPLKASAFYVGMFIKS